MDAKPALSWDWSHPKIVQANFESLGTELGALLVIGRSATWLVLPRNGDEQCTTSRRAVPTAWSPIWSYCQSTHPQSW